MRQVADLRVVSIISDHIFSLPSGGRSIEPEGSEVRMMEGFTRSLPSSPLLNLRLAKRTGRSVCPSV